jgi:hypothetical protein
MTHRAHLRAAMVTSTETPRLQKPWLSAGETADVRPAICLHGKALESPQEHRRIAGVALVNRLARVGSDKQRVDLERFPVLGSRVGGLAQCKQVMNCDASQLACPSHHRHVQGLGCRRIGMDIDADCAHRVVRAGSLAAVLEGGPDRCYIHDIVPSSLCEPRRAFRIAQPPSWDE